MAEPDTGFFKNLENNSKFFITCDAKQPTRIYRAYILPPYRGDIKRDYFITHYSRNFSVDLFYHAYAYQSIDRHVISICQGNQC